jgi:hypothetical protein
VVDQNGGARVKFVTEAEVRVVIFRVMQSAH